MAEIPVLVDMSAWSYPELAGELTRVQIALDGEPDVVMTGDGVMTVGVGVLDLLDCEQRIYREFRRRGLDRPPLPGERRPLAQT